MKRRLLFAACLLSLGMSFAGPERKTVILLGDSIRMGYGPQVRELMKDRADVVYPEENGMFAYYTLRMIWKWTKLVPDPNAVDVIHFNNGLWDLGQRDGRDCLTPIDVYASTLPRIVDELRHFFPNARIVFATTTPVNESVACEQHTKGNAEVERYNAAARFALAGCVDAVNDLYGFVREHGVGRHYRDIVHYTPEGCRLLAEQVVRSIDAVGVRTRLPTLKADGVARPVERARCSAFPYNVRWPGHQRTLDQTEICGFALLTLGTSPLSVEIEFPECPEKVTVRPLAKGIAPRTEGRKVRFEIAEPGAYAVETGGSRGAFFLFVDPPMDFAVDRKDPKVRYYGPGEHDVGLIELKSGETLFLAEGAVVYGRVFARDADDIRILGRGILDASRVRAEKVRDDPEKDREEMAKGFAVCNVRRHDAMRLEFCDRVRIEGIVIRDAPGYTIRPVGCRDLEIACVKVIGNWRYNSDGFDMHNCRRVRIHDCFLRTFDDTICVKGFDYVMDESHMLHDGEMHDIFEDVRVERCVLWNDWGRTLEIGAETRAKEIRDVTFRDCDLIHTTHAACDIQNVDYAAVRNVLYEDIRIELDDGPLHPLMQRPGDAGYYDKGKGAYLPMAMCALVLYIPEYSAGGAKRGTIDGVTFRNIRITAPRMPPSLFRGFDGNHGCRNIVMDGIYLNGKRVPAAESNAKAEKFAAFDWR